MEGLGRLSHSDSGESLIDGLAADAVERVEEGAARTACEDSEEKLISCSVSLT